MVNVGCVNWLFGRGLSIACNLTWSVPELFARFSREQKIARIKAALTSEMACPSVDTEVIKNYLFALSQYTAEGWSHRFITTNWDYLLQREVLSFGLVDQPRWMTNSHVYHLNGTVEVLEDNSHRSPFLLEEDPASQRCFTPEADDIFNKILGDKMFVVVGMSFECETDKFLLSSISRAEDDMPIGESTWLVLNLNWDAMNEACTRIKACLPDAVVMGRCTDFSKWVKSGMYDLSYMGMMKAHGKR